MGKLHWYKRYPDDALAGMMELTLEERGAYNTVLDLIYARDGNLIDDERFIAGWLRVDVRVWRRLRSRLFSLGKLYTRDGCINNSRADSEVQTGLNRVVNATEAAEIRWKTNSHKKDVGVLRGLSVPASVLEVSETQPLKSDDKTNKNNDIADAEAVKGHMLSRTRTRLLKKESPIGLSKESRPQALPAVRDEPDSFVVWYAAYPRKVGRDCAARAYRTALAKADADELLDGLRRARMAWERAGTEARYIPHPATWLNRRGWADEDFQAGPKDQISVAAEWAIEMSQKMNGVHIDDDEMLAGARSDLPVAVGNRH